MEIERKRPPSKQATAQVTMQTPHIEQQFRPVRSFHVW